tara:strand:+ start:296 stop:520 length:225 start_codon:yes stop_codon:yes gene_type:complete
MNTFFALYILTVPDIMENNVNLKRVVFHDHETCMYVAQSLNQVLDPVAKKQNCIEVDNFIITVRTPLPKPEFMK